MSSSIIQHGPALDVQFEFSSECHPGVFLFRSQRIWIHDDWRCRDRNRELGFIDD
jgi:hypothetical protein